MAGRFFGAALVAAMLVARPASAHLMEDQKGTLKFVGSGAFLAISLPVSGFVGVDDDGDGGLSASELRDHWKQIEDQVTASVQLRDASGPRPLEGIILDTSPPHERPDEPATHVVALGRFALGDPKGVYTLHVGLLGKKDGEREFEVGVTRNEAKRMFVMDAGHPEAAL